MFLSTRSKSALSIIIAIFMVLAGLIISPAKAAPRSLTWSNEGTFPLAGSSKILTIKYENGIFMAVASNGDVFNSSTGLSWTKVGTLNGQGSTPTPPNEPYKADLAFGLSGTPVGNDVGVAGTPTWVFTGKDTGSAWTSTDNGATWSVTISNAGILKKVAYGDGHFLVGGQSLFRTSTNGINWRDAGNANIAGDSNGKITFGDHTFVIPITYSNKVCRRSTLNWVDDSAFDCTATFPGAPTDPAAGNYWYSGAFGNGVFVSGLNGGTAKDFWTSLDTGATWTRLFSSTTQPTSVTFGGGVFVIDKSGGTTAFSADGLTWTETGNRPGGPSGLIAYGNGRFIGLGGTYGEVITTGSLSTVAPSTPTGLAGVAGNALVDLTWNASADNGGAAATYTVTSTPGSFSCTTSGTSCQITGLTNDTSYTFTVTASNVVGSSAASSAATGLTPAIPVASITAGSTLNSQLATIPAGVTAATLPATAELPTVSLNFAAANSSATATVAPIANPAGAAATPFAVTSATKIVDIQVSGITGPVTVCLDGLSTDKIFHYTSGAWVELPQRTFANGQVCGVTASFSPFAAAAPVVRSATQVKQVPVYTGPQINSRLPRAVNVDGSSEVTISGERMAQVTSVLLEGKPLTIVSKSDSQIVVKAPAHATGFVDLVLKSDSVSLVFQEAFEYKAPVAARVPVTTSKSLVMSNTAAKSLSSAQQKTLRSFVASANTGAVLNCQATYVSKSDVAVAKSLAADACAVAKKSNSYLTTKVLTPVRVKAKSARTVLLSLTR